MAAVKKWVPLKMRPKAAALQENVQTWEKGRQEATQERSKAGSAHSAQAMACVAVSMPAMKKILLEMLLEVCACRDFLLEQEPPHEQLGSVWRRVRYLMGYTVAG